MNPVVPSLRSGRFHEQPLANCFPPEFPFEGSQAPDLYPRNYVRPYSVQCKRYQPRIALRTSRTNLWSFSNFVTGGWTLSGLAAAAAVANPRDGVADALPLYESAPGTGPATLTRSHTFAAAAWHCMSAFAAYLGRDWILLRAYDGTEYSEGWFNLSTGATKLYADIINPTLLNGGFETAGAGGADVFANWTEDVTGGGTVVDETVIVHGGGHACKLSPAGASAGVVAAGALTVGRRYRIAFWGRDDGSGRILNVQTGAGIVFAQALTATYTLYTADFIATFANLFIFSTTAGLLYVDDVTVTPTGPVPLLSSSLLNGGFEAAGAGGADVFANWTEVTTGGGTVVDETVLVHSGGHACKLSPASSAAGVTAVGLLTIGRRYRITFWARDDGSGRVLNIQTGAGIVFSQGLSAAYTLYTADFVATFADLFIFSTTAGSLYVDDVTLIPLDVPVLTMTRCQFPGDAYWHCEMAFFPRAAAGSATLLLSPDGTTAAYALDATKGVIPWGLQLNTGTRRGAVIDTFGGARTISAPEVDPDDVFAWQVGESKPSVLGGDLLRIERTYGRIPGEQLGFDWQSFARPPLHDLKSGSTYAVCFTPERDKSWLFTSRKSVSTLGDAVATYTSEGNTRGVLPHALITIRLNNSTQTFYGDDTDTTIKNALSTALQGNTSAASSFYIQRNADGFVITYQPPSTNNIIFYTLSCASVLLTAVPNLQVTPGLAYAAIPELITVQANERAVPAQRTITTGSAHGGSAGDWVAIWNGDLLAGMIQALSASGSTLTIPADEAPWNNASLIITHLAFASQAAMLLVNGTKDCAVRLRRQFYGPGVTMLASGSTMATAADIPTANVYSDPQSWLDQIVAGTAFVVISAGQREQYAGFIVSRQLTEIQMSIALAP